MQPRFNTLLQMFGDDTPIGAFAQGYYNDDLKSAADIDSAVRAVTNYAQRLHSEQKSYEDISPYGGEDITVSSVWEIAMGEIPTLQKLPFFSDMTNAEIKFLMVDDFLEEGSLPFQLTDFVQNYEKLSALVNNPEAAIQQVERKLEDREQALGKLASAVEKKTNELKATAREGYSKAEKEMEALNSRRFSRIFRRRKFAREKETLEIKMEKYSIQMETSLDEALTELDINDFDNPSESFPHLIDVEMYEGYLETGHFSHVQISSVEQAREHIKEMADIVHSPDNRELYEHCCHLLGKEPIQLSAQDKEASSRFSVRERLQEAKKELGNGEQFAVPSQAMDLGGR